MKDQSKIFTPATSETSLNAISSPASESGPMPCAKPDGPMTEKSGLEVAPANLSARQAKEAGLLTSGTYGPRFIASSESVRLESSLVNRLQVKTASIGSVLFRLTWKQRDTPLGVSICALRASVPRTSDKDCTSSEPAKPAPWITPQTHDTTVRGNVTADHHYSPHDLSNQALLASWPTPSVHNYEQADQEALEKRRRECKERTGNGNGFGMTLGNTAHSVLPTASGQMPSGSPAETASTGQLNPVLPRWLQGLPTAWENCADMVMPLRHRSRKVSSKRILK